MKVFVTGATGFVGRHIVHQLIEKGHSIRALTHRSEPPKEFQEKNIEHVTGDITNASSIKKALSGCEAVIHLIGIIVESGKATFEQIHYLGTRNLIQETLKAGITRFVHMSALGARSAATSHYHVTKFMAEESLRESTLAQTIFQPSIIFGRDDQFVNQLVKVVRLSPIVPIITTPKGQLQPISVDDVAHCFVDCLERPETFYQTYQLGGPQTYTLRELFETIANKMEKKRLFIPIPVSLLVAPAWCMEKMPIKAPLTLDQLRMLDEENTCDITPAKQTFNVPTKSLEDGLKEII